MAVETLLTASRRVVRFVNIDMNKGGLLTVPTQQAIETLDKMVRAEDARIKTELERAQAAVAQELSA